jgi:F-type H+-transporting ATPase subunit gamma
VSQLAQLKQQIKSVQTTKKITHAVRLVSMSLYAKLEKQRVPMNTYMSSVRSLFLRFTQGAHWNDPFLFPNDVLDQNPLFLIIGTSKGLCGSLNSNLFRYAKKSMFVEPHQKLKLIAIGQKAVKFAKEAKIGELICFYHELTSHNLATITDDLMEKILNTDQPYSSVTILSNELKSFFMQRPLKTTLTPACLDNYEGDSHDSESINKQTDLIDDQEIILEQDRDDIAKYLAHLYVRTTLVNTLFQALIAEQAARFVAMDGSYTNADKILERLTIQFNKLRQALITKEVAELSASLPGR